MKEIKPKNKNLHTSLEEYRLFLAITQGPVWLPGTIAADRFQLEAMPKRKEPEIEWEEDLEIDDFQKATATQ